MPKYSIEFTPTAAKQLRKLSREIQIRVAKIIDKLATESLPVGVKKLVNEDELFRVRVGDYRIIYQINSGKLIVLIIRLGHRRDIY